MAGFKRVFTNNTNFLMPKRGEHVPQHIDTIFGPGVVMAPELQGLKYNEEINIMFRNTDEPDFSTELIDEKTAIKKDIIGRLGNKFRYFHGDMGIGDPGDDQSLYTGKLNQATLAALSQRYILGFQSLKNIDDFIRIVVEENGDYVLFDGIKNSRMEIYYDNEENKRIKLIANKSSPDSYINIDNKPNLKEVPREVPTLQTIAAKKFVQYANEKKENVHALYPSVKPLETMNILNSSGNGNVPEELKKGGKRRTRRRRQRSNKKRTNKRKKTKTRMKRRKTSKRKTNKRRRKR